MGFFRRLLRGPGLGPPQSFVPPAYPWSGEVRVYNWEYKRLSTGWWRVTATSPTEWETKVREMEEGLYRHFGIRRTKDGRVVPRWNPRAWEGVQRGLVVEGR
jgi:hypothetical protein